MLTNLEQDPRKVAEDIKQYLGDSVEEQEVNPLSQNSEFLSGETEVMDAGVFNRRTKIVTTLKLLSAEESKNYKRTAVEFSGIVVANVEEICKRFENNDQNSYEQQSSRQHEFLHAYDFEKNRSSHKLLNDDSSVSHNLKKNMTPGQWKITRNCMAKLAGIPDPYLKYDDIGFMSEVVTHINDRYARREKAISDSCDVYELSYYCDALKIMEENLEHFAEEIRRDIPGNEIIHQNFSSALREIDTKFNELSEIVRLTSESVPTQSGPRGYDKSAFDNAWETDGATVTSGTNIGSPVSMPAKINWDDPTPPSTPPADDNSTAHSSTEEQQKIIIVSGKTEEVKWTDRLSKRKSTESFTEVSKNGMKKESTGRE